MAQLSCPLHGAIPCPLALQGWVEEGDEGEDEDGWHEGGGAGGGDIDDDEDEAFVEQAEHFEHAYNFRFEEPGAARIVTHPRNVRRPGGLPGAAGAGAGRAPAAWQHALGARACTLPPCPPPLPVHGWLCLPFNSAAPPPPILRAPACAALQVEGTVRKEDDRRKRTRQEKAARQAAEEETRRAELRRLKNLKRAEIDSK